MSDLTKILNGPWSPPQEHRPDPPETQLKTAMINAGITPPEEIVLDGKLHRFNSHTKGKPGHDKPGYYVAFGDGIPAGHFGCWRLGLSQQWKADVGREISTAEQMAMSRRMAEAQAVRDAEQEKKRETAANTVDQIWTEAGAATPDHPYLERKGIQPHGARITGDGRLIVPLYDNSGQLSSLQYISHDGEKRYHTGGATGGRFWSVGTLDEPGTVYLAEGFATAATIHETTGRPCFVSYSASNLVPVAEIIRQHHSDLVIVADNDDSRIGQRYAEQAAAKYGARLVIPPTPGDANDYAQAGHDLHTLLTPPKNDWLIPADEFAQEPAPISWLIKRWLQNQALMMVHGPSGSGKTFVVLDMCLRIASGYKEWMGAKVHNGDVVYLAGEGHHGLRGRVAAWKHHNQASQLNMWLSRDGCDLNTPAGYQRVADSLRGLDKPPSLVVVDTLHRFLAGDENSAQDTKTMLDACNGLMQEFQTSVLLVHHTGNSEEAQHRARGSSAWKGALDIEISVVPAKHPEDPIQVIQRKSKDAELAPPVYAELQSVGIPGWFDEDGEQVTSAVMVESAAPVERKKDTKLAEYTRRLNSAWLLTGKEIDAQGRPYITRSALLDYLVTQVGIPESSAKQEVKPSVTNRLVGHLIDANIIAPVENGWSIIDQDTANSLQIGGLK